ncbi:hypothetical protein [Arthrobacter oryzae]|nr:hypothetical protein [Arthrobacter oryzae]
MPTRDVLGIATAATALAVLSGCAAPAAPQSNVPTSPTTTTVSSIPFALFTHCGIHEARVRDTFFAADQPLDDGHGNPPAGWGNPYQSGTITVEGSRAVFRDGSGHTVAFHERRGATSFLKTCS